MPISTLVALTDTLNFLLALGDTPLKFELFVEMCMPFSTSLGPIVLLPYF